MRKLIDKDEFRSASKDRVEVHFSECAALVIDDLPRDNFKTVDKSFCFGPAMGLYDADNYIRSP